MEQLLHTLPISPYLLLRIVAAVFALIFVIAKRKAFGIRLSDTFKMIVFAAFGTIIGAKALYIIGQIVMRGSAADFWTLDNWSNMVKAGGVLYGSVFGIFAMIFLFAKIFDYKVMNLFALASITMLGANFFSHIGCLLAGCCYGVRLSNGTQFPYQLAEGILCALVFICFAIWKPEKKHKDIILPLSVILYGVIRFSLEFFRGDEDRGVWFALSTSQWISIAMILIGAAVLLLKKRRKKAASQ
jgi:phosphatidylglycerol:prolipoprotein diacylglycerol transferase